MNKYSVEFELSNVTEIAQGIHEELAMAKQADTAAVLYVLYGIQQDKEDAKQELRKLVEADGIVPMPFSFEKYNDHLAKGLPCFVKGDMAVCVDVSKLGKGSLSVSELVNVLAANKNKIIENKVKLVVWMTCEEAIQFSHISPDLWSFRHRMFDLNMNYCAVPIAEEMNVMEPAKQNAVGFEQFGEGLVNLTNADIKHLNDPKVQQLLTNVTLALIKQDLAKAESLITDGIQIANELGDLTLTELLDRALSFIQNEHGESISVVPAFQAARTSASIREEKDVIAECDAHLKNGDRYAAIKTLTDHLESGVGADMIWEKLGDVYKGFGIFDKAIDAYNRVTCGCADLQAVALKKADCFAQVGKANEAIDIYKAALRSADDETVIVSLWNKIGDAYTKVNKHEEAIAAYSYADHRDISNTKPMRSLIGKKSAVNSPSLTAEMWNEIGNIFSKTGDDQEAAIAYQKSIDMNINNGYAYGNLAKLQSRQGDHRSAKVTIRTGIKSAQDKEQIQSLWNLLGDEFRLSGNYDDAMTAYRNADLIKTGSKAMIQSTNYSNYSANVRF